MLGLMSTSSIRAALAILVGSTAYYATWRIKGIFAIYSMYGQIAPNSWQGFVPDWTQALNILLPGFLVGLIAPSRPIRHAIVAVPMGCVYVAINVLFNGYAFRLNAFANNLVLASIYAAALSCCSSYVKSHMTNRAEVDIYEKVSLKSLPASVRWAAWALLAVPCLIVWPILISAVLKGASEDVVTFTDLMYRVVVFLIVSMCCCFWPFLLLRHGSQTAKAT